MNQFDLREKLTLLDRKIEKTETVVFQMSDTQSKLKDAATKRKTALAAVYQHMRDMLAQEECKAQHEVDLELETGQTKLRDLMKRLTDNTEKMTKAREDIDDLLSQSKSLGFLQASFNLPQVVKYDPHMPRINLDSKKVTASQVFSAALKEYLTEIFKHPVEARLPILKPGERAELNTGVAASEQKPPQATDDNMGNKNQTQLTENLEFGAPAAESSEIPEAPEPPEEWMQPSSYGPACPPSQMFFQTYSAPFHCFRDSPAGWIPPQFAHGKPPGSYRRPPLKPGDKKKPAKKPPSAPGGHKSSAKGSDSTKKDKPKSHPPSTGKPPSTPGENKSSAKGPDSTKKDKPKSHPPSAKSTKPHPQPGKKK